MKLYALATLFKHHLPTTALVTVLLLLVAGTNAQDASPLGYGDGPYVLYQNDSIIVKQVTSRFGIPVVAAIGYPLSAKGQIVLPVKFTNKKKWNFEVKLQPQLVNEPAVWRKPSRLLALSDIEGEFAALRSLLIGNKVMDKAYNWIYGDGHVVLCGDLFDRGLNVTEQLWLLYKLEQDAKTKGGYLHVVLGNHDIMNLSGDLRYVQPKYLANAEAMKQPYTSLYNEQTELGRWLRTKNIVEKIGDFLCMHAGISREVLDLQYSVQQLNSIARPFYSRGDPDSLASDPPLATLFNDNAPFWYRGYFVAPRATQGLVDSTLKVYDVKTIVIGHTITERNVTGYYQNKVLGLDVNHHAGNHQGALFENGAWYQLNTSGRKRLIFTVE